MIKKKRKIILLFIFTLIIGSLVSCGQEKREYLDNTYVEDKMDHGIFSSDTDNFLKNCKNRYVKWTAAIKVREDKKTLILQEKNLPEIYAKFDKEYDKDNKYNVGDIITISGEVVNHVSGPFGIGAKWELEKCRIEETDQADIEKINKYRKSLENENVEIENNNKENSYNNDYSEKKDDNENNIESVDENIDFSKEGTPKKIIGSTRNQILKLFQNYRIDKRYEEVVNSNAIKFENDDCIVVVNFDKNKKAKGVSFLSSMNYKSDDGKDSYVNKNYDKLIKLACGNEKVKIERDYSAKYPIEIYIGNMHD